MRPAALRCFTCAPLSAILHVPVAVRRSPLFSGAAISSESLQTYHVCLRVMPVRCLSTTATAFATPTSSRPGPTVPASGGGTSALPSIEPLLEELRRVVTRPLPIGDVFRALSPSGRQLLVRHKVPLEELFLHLPGHFVLFRQGNLVKRFTVHVAPPYLVPQKVKVMRLQPGTKPLPALVALNIATPTTPTPLSSPSAALDPSATRSAGAEVTTDSSDPFTMKRRIEELLLYVPNEWTPFVNLDIPEAVKVKCMGYPVVRPLEFFAKHPNYFEVRVQDSRGSTFLLRRSAALQQRIAASQRP